jgi:NAD(P)H-hydrate epimerase
MTAAAPPHGPATALTSSHEAITLLTQRQAAHIDEVLMESFSTDQLMELAGLSVAQVVQAHFHVGVQDNSVQKIVVLCGPGNNGGDGLVAARHLKMFDAAPAIIVVYPRLATMEKPLYKRLVQQLKMCDVSVVAEFDESLLLDETGTSAKNTIVIDAMLGYSSSGQVREPYRAMIESINRMQRLQQLRCVAVDIPSGWDVELGPPPNTGAVALHHPDVLVSLMSPKLGVRSLMAPVSSESNAPHRSTAHYVGGRFVPSQFQKEYELQLPTFPVGGEQYVRIA